MNQSANKPASYGDILRSSWIIGGSQVLVYLISIGRTKAAALLLGPVGVGTLSMYQAIVSMVGTVSGLGLGNSGVREIAEASGNGDVQRVTRTCGIVQRLAFLTGILGWVLAAALAYPLSRIAFDDIQHTSSIALIGACLLLGSVGTSYAAILQGTRQISSLAKFQVLSNGFAAASAVLLFFIYGLRGIVPSIIAGAVINCSLAWWMKRRIAARSEPVTWKESLRGSRKLVIMGAAFMWNAVSTGMVAFGIRAMVVHQNGLEAAGIYQAAWAISGMFAGFILQAMGTDFYPRLTAAASNPRDINRLVNEQTEIGVLLAGPGVLATLALSPYLLEWLYSAKFITGTTMVCWFAIGVFGQVISWPLGFIQIARGATKAFMITQTLFNGVHFGLITVFFGSFGLNGVAIAYASLYFAYTTLMLIYAYHIIGFLWSGAVVRLVSIIGIMVSLGFFLALCNHGIHGTAAGLLLAVISGFFCSRELIVHLPEHNRLRLLLRRLPGMTRDGQQH